MTIPTHIPDYRIKPIPEKVHTEKPAALFNAYFKGSKNFITNVIVGYECQVKGLKIEKSKGYFCDSEVYGVTVMFVDSEKRLMAIDDTLCSCTHDQKEADDLITEIMDKYRN